MDQRALCSNTLFPLAHKLQIEDGRERVFAYVLGVFEQLTATHEADTRRLRGVSALAQLAGAWARATRLLDRAARAARARAFVRWCASSADAGVRAARSARGPMRPDDAKLDDLRRARLRAVVARAGIGRPLRLAWRRMLEYCAEVSVFYYDVSNPCDD